MLLYHRPVPAKIPKRRSRAEKKKKCNEERPSCDRCLERGLRCEYEPVKPRKRRRTVSNPEHMGMRPPTTNPGQHYGFHDRLQALRQDSSSGSSILSASPTPPLPAIAENWEVHSADSVFSDSASSCGSDLPDMNSPLPPFTSFDSMPRTQPTLDEIKSLPMDPLDGFARDPFDEDSHHHHREIYMHQPALSRSSSYPDPTSAFLSPQSTGSPYDFTSTMHTPTVPSQSPSLPAFAEYTRRESRRGLLDHFCNVLSHLIVFKEDSGNPFRQLVLPMARQSPPLLNAIYAISSAHLEHRGLQVEERALDLHSEALKGLAGLIAHKDEGNRDEVLAVIILLLYYEIVRSGSSTVLNSHLRGALSIMRERRTRRGPTSPFLERAFRYFDVASALSFGCSPMSGTIIIATEQDFVSIHDRSAMASVDTLFGLIGDLWPIIHRLASLVEVKRTLDKEDPESPDGEQMRNMRADFETNTTSIELALQQWIPKIPPSVVTLENPADDSRLQSIMNNAEAHKQASFVFLYRNLLSLPRSDQKVQTPTKQTLQACLRVVIFSGPMTTLVWPLFTASCEATEDVDRNVARTVFRHLETRQGMNNIVTAWEVCEEIWRRSDAGQENLEWREVAQSMEKEILFG
ncbi:uncharacterized protein KY384_006565 [Bacidia gigantensis]|uniref:uncharacterized protein n=1 Tax=Bacidia gigantensis TaxID=2732470 RepID=UPI001D04644F|nr:uncharacterized protein KY384_006565 [Bacidia gigantensis]KAG8528876.1 hypothetical protein KY384_006565 [Bacidia gigantensis]